MWRLVKNTTFPAPSTERRHQLTKRFVNSAFTQHNMAALIYRHLYKLSRLMHIDTSLSTPLYVTRASKRQKLNHTK